MQREPFNEEIRVSLMVQTREALGKTTYRALHDAGQALPLDAALVEARAWMATST